MLDKTVALPITAFKLQMYKFARSVNEQKLIWLEIPPATSRLPIFDAIKSCTNALFPHSQFFFSNHMQHLWFAQKLKSNSPARKFLIHLEFIDRYCSTGHFNFIIKLSAANGIRRRLPQTTKIKRICFRRNFAHTFWYFDVAFRTWCSSW